MHGILTAAEVQWVELQLCSHKYNIYNLTSFDRLKSYDLCQKRDKAVRDNKSWHKSKRECWGKKETSLIEGTATQKTLIKQMKGEEKIKI